MAPSSFRTWRYDLRNILLKIGPRNLDKPLLDV